MAVYGRLPRRTRTTFPTQNKAPSPWLQLAGIFSKDRFSPLEFLTTLHRLYNLVVTEGVNRMDLSPKYKAFLFPAGTAAPSRRPPYSFPLYSHLAPLSDSISHQWIDDRDGHRFICLHTTSKMKSRLLTSHPGGAVCLMADLDSGAFVLS
jgi:hypothetical protein